MQRDFARYKAYREFKRHYQEMLTTQMVGKKNSIRECERKIYRNKKSNSFYQARLLQRGFRETFPFVVWICWNKPNSMGYLGGGDFDFWDKEAFFKEALQ